MDEGKGLRSFIGKKQENLDGVATLVTDLAPGYSTTKQNPHICNQPLYGAITRRVEWRISVGEGLLQNGATLQGSRPT